MSDDLKSRLNDRLRKAVRQTFDPCPLITERWLQSLQSRREVGYRFIGVRKLAKATGRSVEKTLAMLLPRVRFDDLGVTMEIAGASDLIFRPVAPAPKPAGAPRPPRPPKATAKPAGQKPAGEKPGKPAAPRPPRGKRGPAGGKKK
jgi:hypothetical protein